MVSELESFENTEKTIFCVYCGNKMKASDKFCSSCGSKAHLIEQYEENNVCENDRGGICAVKNHIKDSGIKNSNALRSRLPIIIGIIIVVLLVVTAIYAYATHLSPVAQARNQLELGNKFLYAGKYEEAILAFEKVIKIQPKNIEARLGLSKAYLATDQPDKAELVLKEALGIDPEREDIYLALFDLYLAIGEGKEAVRILKDGIEETDSGNLHKKLEEIVPSEPKANLKSGKYIGMKTVELIGRDEDSAIYYTLDGSEVSKDSEQYTEPIKLKEGKTILKAASINKYGIIGDTIEYEYIIVSAYGNSCGNFMNGSLVAESDEWIYHINFSAVYGDPYWRGLSRTGKDDSDSVMLSDGSCSNINVLGDWIYFLKNEFGYSKICRVKSDGSDKSLVVEDYSNKLLVVGEWIYYINQIDDGKLYKIKTDGSSKTKICDDIFMQTYETMMFGLETETSDFYVIDEWIYYINLSDNGKLYKIKTDGSSRTKLSDDHIYSFNVYGDTIYYNNTADGWKFYTVKTDGSNNRKLCDYGAYETFNVYNGWIYYCDTMDGEL